MEETGWHDCDQQCLRLHSTFPLKFLSLIIEARSSGRMGPSDNVSIIQDNTFNLISSRPAGLAVKDTAKSVQVAVYLEDDGSDRSILLDNDIGSGGKTTISVESLRKGILLEVWSLMFESSGSFIVESNGDCSLNNFIIDCCLLLRSVYCQLRILPANRLRRKFKLRLGRPSTDTDTTTFTTCTPEVINTSPHGTYRFTVKYRRNCSFHHAAPPIPVTVKSTNSFERIPLGVPGSTSSLLGSSTPVVYSTPVIKPPAIATSWTRSNDFSLSTSNSNSNSSVPKPQPTIVQPMKISSHSHSHSQSSYLKSSSRVASGSLSSRCSSSLLQDDNLLTALQRLNSISPPHNLEYRLRSGDEVSSGPNAVSRSSGVMFHDLPTSIAIIKKFLLEGHHPKVSEHSDHIQDNDHKADQEDYYFDEFIFNTEI